jgi:hypothetical protein
VNYLIRFKAQACRGLHEMGSDAAFLHAQTDHVKNPPDGGFFYVASASSVPLICTTDIAQRGLQ